MARKKKDLECSDTPPDVPPVNPDGIPAVLRGCAQWVLWKYERRKDNRATAAGTSGKWTKVPVKAVSRSLASSTDPDSWAEFEGTLAVYRRLLGREGAYPGVGFMFSPEDPFCGVDLDDCRDRETGEIAQWATDIIRRLNSYTEVSPSGTGVKIILQGHVPGGRHRIKYQGGEFEAYDCARFFVITGLRLDIASADVVDAQEAFDAIYSEVFAQAEIDEPPPSSAPPPSPVNLSDAQLLDRIFSSAIGDGFRQLWYGEDHAYEGDKSRGDYHLCRHLAWWCQGDEARVDALFRQSGRIRPKWDEQRGGGTYGEKTVAFAVARTRSFYDPAARRAATLNVTDTQRGGVAPQAASPVAVANPSPTSAPVAPASPAPPAGPPASGHILANHVMMPVVQSNGTQIFAPRGLSAPEIAGPLLQATGDWPRRVGRKLFVPHPTQGVRWIDSSASLFAWASRTLRPGAFGNPVNWLGRGADLLTKEEFYNDLGSIATEYEAIEQYPHEPARDRVFYCPYQTAGGDGSAVSAFLDFFVPSTPCDRQLLLAVLLTACWGGPPGQRPAFVFVSPDGRGAGKTTAAQMIAEIWDGFIKVRVDDDFSEVQRRVLSAEGQKRRFFLMDNVKESRLSLADVEDMITCNRISGRQMYEGEGSRPNYFTWLMTYNGVQLSSDLAQRSIIIQLRRPKLSGQWAEQVGRFIRDNRPTIIGDLVAMLRGPRAEDILPVSRWALWETEILARVSGPEEIQRLTLARQASVDDDQENMELVREAFCDALRRNGYDPEACAVFFTTRQAITLASRVPLGTRQQINSPSKLRLLNIPELTKDRKNSVRGFRWQGPKSSWERGGRLDVFEPSHPLDRGIMADANGDHLPD